MSQQIASQEEQASGSNLDRQIAALEDELRGIAPEVIANDPKAKTRSLALHEEIDSLRLRQQMESFAEQEQARRAEEERKAKAEEQRRKALVALVKGLEERVAQAARVEKALTELVAAAVEFKAGGIQIQRLQQHAGQSVDHKLKDATRLVERISTALYRVDHNTFSRHARSIDLAVETGAVLEATKGALP